jgi:hypothetical protein
VKTVRTKKSSAPSVTPVPVTGPETEDNRKAGAKDVAPATSSAPPSGSERKSVAWYEDANGKIDFDRMRDSSKAQLKKILSDPAIAAQFGVSKSAVPQAQFVSDEMVGAFYSVLGSVESMIASKVFKVDSSLAARAFAFDEEKKKALTPLTIKVANKYAWDWLAKYGDEIMLASVFVSVTMSQVLLLKNLQALQAANPNFVDRAARGERGPVPISRRDAAATADSTVTPPASAPVLVSDDEEKIPAEPTEQTR